MADPPKSLYIEDGVLKNLEKDLFGHKHIAGAVVDSILRTNPPFTIGIFGGWGTGKSSLLEIIDTELVNNNIATVTIDAWRYSSAENLRRAFLVHIASKLTPNLLDDLRRKLFSSEQETLPANPSKVDLSSKSWSDRVKAFVGLVFKSAAKFVGLFLLFLAILLSFYLAIFWLDNAGFANFSTTFDWLSFRDTFLGLAIVPLLLTLIDDLRVYIIQRPVTIVHERIDADELFSQCFDNVVDEATNRWFSRKRLVIFVDNLDRLTNKKMVEALESLKTYLSNPMCIFVVACDDNVVRAVVNKSDDERSSGDGQQVGIKAGEHYLDKFFQQTFRLPEHMEVNLHDFARQNFETTFLHEELIARSVDSRYLISIILPSDVNSPRKVKRLLNEFIALYEIVKRREGGKDRQLTPGQLSTNVEFLGKFSTIRAEYPEFYQLLVEDTSALFKVTEAIQQENLPEISSILGASYNNRLVSYLRKTQTILVDELDPYIWLSQDRQSLGLPGNQNKLLRSSLSEGNVEQMRSLLQSAEDATQRILMVNVACNIVEQNSSSIDQQNGIKALAYLLPTFDDVIKPSVAHLAVTLMIRPSEFTAREILNVLHWAQRGGIDTQRKKLIENILVRLENKDARIKTFEAILENAKVVEGKQFTSHVRERLAEILKAENQMTPKSVVDPEAIARITANQEFANWLVSQAEKYSDNDFVIEKYFSTDLVDYATSRLFDGESKLEGLALDKDPLGLNIAKLLDVITARLQRGTPNPHYWTLLLRCLASDDPKDVEYALDKSNELALFIPLELVERFVSGAFRSINKFSESKAGDEENHDLLELLRRVIELTFRLRRNKGSKFDIQALETLSSDLSNLFKRAILLEHLLPLVEDYSKEFGPNEAGFWIAGMLNAIADPVDNRELAKVLIGKSLELEEYLSEEHRQRIATKIDGYIKSNEQSQIEFALSLIEKLSPQPGYHGAIKKNQSEWLAQLGVDPLPILQTKIRLFESLVERRLLDLDEYIGRLTSLMPFGGDSERLRTVIDSIERFRNDISAESGKLLANALLAHHVSFGTQISRALGIASIWVESVEDAERDVFDSAVLQHYTGTPDEYLPIMSVSWNALTAEQIQGYIIKFYRVGMDDKLADSRDKVVKKALGVLVAEERSRVAAAIWENLLHDGNAAESFMRVGKSSLILEDLNAARQNSMNLVKETTDIAQLEMNLRFLASTIRDDTRSIMPVVDLFVELFGRSRDEAQLALKYAVPCLSPFGLRDDHHDKLAKAMRKMPIEIDDELDGIKQTAKQLGLKWFRHEREKGWFQ